MKKNLKPKLLIYAHYYYPDVASTGQILTELAEGMINEFDITVICVVPSYSGIIDPCYKRQKYFYETHNGVNIIRVRVPEFTKSNKFSRVRNILTYFFRAIWATFQAGKHDYVYSVSQPPILGGVLGVIGKKIKKAKFIYNIQDFNPEQIMAVDYSKSSTLLKILMLADKHSCKKADSIIVVGRDMVETLKKRFSNMMNLNYCFINNWVNEQQLYPLPDDHKKVKAFKRKYFLENKYIIMYSGNLGLYYDLENIIKVFKSYGGNIKSSDGREVAFVFVGDGVIKNELISYVESNRIKNITFIPYQPKEELIYSLNACDCHICNNAKGVKGISVPSKLYGIMAVGKPVLGILESNSEAKLIIEESGCGFVSEPGEYEQLKENIEKFLALGKEQNREMGMLAREYLEQNLTQTQSIYKYIEILKSC